MTQDDVEYVLNQLGGDGGYKRNGDNLTCNCVNAEWGHDGGVDNGHKMGVLCDGDATLVNCFRPGCFRGNIMQLVDSVGQKLVADGRMTFKEIANLRAFVMLAEEDAPRSMAAAKTTVATVLPLPSELLARLGEGSAYWTERGADAASELDWGLMEWGGRAWFVLARKGAAVTAVQGRLLPGLEHDSEGHSEKYRTMPRGFQKAEFLPGSWNIRPETRGVVVVESPFDAILLTQYLRDAQQVAVALMGGEPSEKQVDLLVGTIAAGTEVIGGLDTDPAGRVGQRKLVQMLRRRVRNLSEAAWRGNDPSDTEGGTLTAAQVRTRALESLAQRQRSTGLLLARKLGRGY